MPDRTIGRTVRPRVARLGLVAAAIAATAALGCDGHPLYEDAAVLDLTLEPDGMIFWMIDDSRELTLRARQGGREVGVPPIVTWESDDPATVSVDERGRVRALRDGTATIRARAGDAVGTAEVTVDATVWKGARLSRMLNEDSNPSNDSDSTAFVVYRERLQ